jgi:amino acid adenylation domain-containing protein
VTTDPPDGFVRVGAGSTGPVAVHDLLDAAAARAGTAPAVRDVDGAWNYAELVEHSLRAASWLSSRGVAPSDRVVVRHPNTRELVALAYGVSRVGAMLVPINPMMSRFQLAAVAADADPALALTADADELSLIGACTSAVTVAWPKAQDELAAAPTQALDAVPDRHPSADDLAVLFYTSGSTAAPKGVMCPHRQILFAAQAIARQLRYGPDDRVLCRLPFAFDYGLYQAYLCAIGGSELVLPPAGQDAALLTRIRQWRVSVVPVVPSLATMLLGLAGRDPRPTELRLFTNTGAALPPATVNALRQRFPGAQVCLMFGTTECKRVSILEPDGDLDHPGSVGRPLDGTVVTVVDGAGRPLPTGEVGEFVVTGPHVADGYWRAPALTAQRFRAGPGGHGRLLYTGDRGYLDADGHLYFVGRSDDIFKRNGTRVSTVEVEAAALDVPGVEAAAAIPPGPHGDLIVVAVGLCPAEDVLRGLRERLEPAKVPVRCVLVPELPTTPNGKVDRVRLIALLNGSTEAVPC